jgi:lactate dehydrogenase-like 2-hydroxyacid dehydrogenase
MDLPDNPGVLVTEPVLEEALRWLEARGLRIIRAWEGDQWEAGDRRIVAIIVRAYRVQVDLLDNLPGVRIIVKHGVGVDTIDLVEAEKRGILVTNTAGANANAVAEHSVALLAALSRDLIDADRLLREGRFTERFGMRDLKELSSAKVGIFGAGRIGSRIARILQGGYGCEIAVFDPYLLPETLEGVQYLRVDSLIELAQWADHLVVASPLTPETRGVINRDVVDALGVDGSLVCASRGGIVNEIQVAEALAEGRLRSAGLDVYSPEPPANDHPLIAQSGTVLTPHIAFASDESMRRMSWDSVRQLWALCDGQEAPLVRPGAWG